MKQKPSARLKRVQITRDFLEDLLFGREFHFRVDPPLPKDAKILAWDFDITSWSLHVVIESKSFDEVSEGARIPLYHVALTDLPITREATP